MLGKLPDNFSDFRSVLDNIYVYFKFLIISFFFSNTKISVSLAAASIILLNDRNTAQVNFLTILDKRLSYLKSLFTHQMVTFIFRISETVDTIQVDFSVVSSIFQLRLQL